MDDTFRLGQGYFWGLGNYFRRTEPWNVSSEDYWMYDEPFTCKAETIYMGKLPESRTLPWFYLERYSTILRPQSSLVQETMSRQDRLVCNTWRKAPADSQTHKAYDHNSSNFKVPSPTTPRPPEFIFPRFQWPTSRPELWSEIVRAMFPWTHWYYGPAVASLACEKPLCNLKLLTDCMITVVAPSNLSSFSNLPFSMVRTSHDQTTFRSHGRA